MNMEQNTLSCLDMVLQEICNTELTQQVKLPDGMPDIGEILSAWGQVILRTKQWQDDELTAGGGVMVWVLYRSESDGKEYSVDCWVPFQIKWDLPEGIPEGNARIGYLLRSVDSRSLSPRKMMIRCGVAARAEAYVPMEREILEPTGREGVELLRATYPLRLVTEAGEKQFQMEEDLPYTDTGMLPEAPVYCLMTPGILEQKVMDDKLVLRGCGNLHMLCRSEEGRLCCRDLQVPFSQIIPLDREYGRDAQGDLLLTVTDLETEWNPEGPFRLRCGITAQYRISEEKLVSLTEDTYSNQWELTAKQELLELPVILEQRRETVFPDQNIPADAESVADLTYLPDYPRIRRGSSGAELEMTGTFQLLCYGKDGTLRAANARWEDNMQLQADMEAELEATPLQGPVRFGTEAGGVHTKAEMPLQLQWTIHQQLPMVTQIGIGEKRIPEEDRPALLLRRAGAQSLWELAKGSGSTVEAIRLANGLQGEPLQDQMLLIPVM